MAKHDDGSFETLNSIYKPASVEANVKYLQDEIDLIFAGAKVLCDRAAELGYVLTIETRPLQPLAMGHYEQVCELRLSNQVYRGGQ